MRPPGARSRLQRRSQPGDHRRARLTPDPQHAAVPQHNLDRCPGLERTGDTTTSGTATGTPGPTTSDTSRGGRGTDLRFTGLPSASRRQR